MCLGSLLGAIAWGFWMQVLVLSYTTYMIPLPQAATLQRQAQHWQAAFSVAYGIQSFCLYNAKVLVLHRLTQFARKFAGSAALTSMFSSRLNLAVRGVILMTVFVHAVAFLANVADAVLHKELGDMFGAAALAFSSNETSTGMRFYEDALRNSGRYNRAKNVQEFCEVVVLLAIIISFVVVGTLSYRLISSSMRELRESNESRKTYAMSAGNSLLTKIGGTTAFLFLSFLLRAVYYTMITIGDTLKNDAPCAAISTSPCDTACYNVWALMDNWIFFTPEFRFSVVFITNPLTMFVVLWGMTGPRTAKLITAANVDEEQTSFGL
jgi:hypothetical protein